MEQRRLRGIVGIGVCLFFLSACGLAQVNQEDDRPSGREVAMQAGEATNEATRDELVLYSTSVGGDEAADDTDAVDDAGEGDVLEPDDLDEEPAEDDAPAEDEQPGADEAPEADPSDDDEDAPTDPYDESAPPHPDNSN